MGRGYSSVTSETKANPQASGPSKNAKIPDVAGQFAVPCISHIEWLRRLGLSL
ncbi:DUF4411 family protein [Aerococcus sanguinicola]|uniref:DUF4411 family protein n=1 Tax=Aerococcus sanguinicola TaxID=119206 RepID=A0A5N1GMJ8_9LACT|nr:DUF4411 family protein [Aerococcus sanguinicola]